jgi:DNA-binding beta-propeller fold protein YncE
MPRLPWTAWNEPRSASGTDQDPIHGAFMTALRLLCCLATVFLAAGAAEHLALVVKADLKEPFAIAEAPAGGYWIAEQLGHRVRLLDAAGTLSPVAGTSTKGKGAAGGRGDAIALDEPHSLVVAPDGALLIADTMNSRALRYDPRTATLSAFAGTGTNGYGGDGGPASAALFGNVYCLALGPGGRTAYVADLDNLRVRAIDLATTTVTTVAGNGRKGIPADGARAAESPLLDPRAVAVDREGRLYVLERSGHCLRMVEDGVIRTVAGTGKAGNGGDGDALAVALNGPKHLCIDRDGSVIIADTENHRIRRYLPTEHRLVTIAGTGMAGGGEPGAPLQTALNRPHGVYIDGAGTLFICDSANGRVLKLVH